MYSSIGAALTRLVTRFEHEEGQALAEYGLIIALVATALVVALGALAIAITGSFNALIAGLP